MRILITILFIISFHISFGQWNADAGIVSPLNSKAKVEVTSGENVVAITDGDRDSYWESTSPLPEKYILRNDLNLFLNRTKYDLDYNNRFTTNAFDGITSSKSEITSGSLIIKFKAPEALLLLSIKINTKDTVWIKVETLKKQFVFSYAPTENYHLKTFEFKSSDEVISINLTSISSFEVFEIAGLHSLLKEEVIFDLLKESRIGWIGSRHYNGKGVVSISVLVSSNKTHWKEVAKLNPQATAFVPTLLTPEITARYIKVSFTLKPVLYQKAKLHEFEVYDKYGPFGTPPQPALATRTYGQSMGINAIWGWGYSVSSTELKKDIGAQMFQRVAKLARNYHGIDWDILKPTDDPNYQKMVQGNGTTATTWINWDTEYRIWKNAGFSIDACIMFNNNQFPDTLWKNTVMESYNYGASFSKHFSQSSPLVSIVEIGNEPWEYSKPVYKDILTGMSKGFRTNSKELIILPCATQAYVKNSVLGNYISKYLNRKNTGNLSGLNTHIYSYTYNYDGDRIAVNPEDPRSEVWSINNLHTFSKSNLSDIPVYVTEFGFDSHGGGDDCTHAVCVSEFEQAIYGARMALILYRFGTEQFYWYFFSNVDYTSMLHNRSGLISSYSKGFEKKKSFFSFELLQEQLGNYYFHSIIMENEEAYVYAFSDENGRVKRIIAWRPTSENHEKNVWVDIPGSYVIEEAIPLASTSDEISIPSYVRSVNSLKISLNGIPIILLVK